MKLSEPQIKVLVWIFYMSCIGGSIASQRPKHTLRALIKRKLVQYHPADYTRVTPTVAGSELVLTQYHHRVIDLSVKTFGLSSPPTVIEETLRRMSSANLPIYLAHEDPRVRYIAREVMEDADGTN